MKVKVIIEEVISQTFEVEIDDRKDIHKQIKELYNNETLLVDSPTLTEVKYAIRDDEYNNETEFITIY